MDILEEFAGGLAPGVSDLHAEDALESERSEKDVIPERKGGLLNRLFKRVEEDEKAQRFPIPVAADAAQRETMIRILESFTANVAADPKMAQASKGKDVAMHFTIRDLDQVFHLYFQDGRVDAGLGEPPVEPHVRLKMSADILDGMFTGRISGNKAAMTGKLSFSGDTRKAMAFQRFSRDMERLYQAAREQVGDPGDLTQLGKTPVRAATPESATQADSYTAPAVIKVGDVRDEILQVTNELYAQRSDHCHRGQRQRPHGR